MNGGMRSTLPASVLDLMQCGDRDNIDRRIMEYLLKAPGLLRTISALLLSAATLVEQFTSSTDLSHGLTKSAVIFGVLGLLRAGIRQAITK